MQLKMKDNILNISTAIFRNRFKNVAWMTSLKKWASLKNNLFLFKNKYELVKESTQLIFENACNDIERIKNQ